MLAQPKLDVARTLKDIADHIKENWHKAQDAAKQAALPYYVSIGFDLIEAKSQQDRGEFVSWIKRNFKFGERQAQEYMQAYRATEGIEKRADGTPELPQSFNEFRREHLGREHAGANPRPSWQAPVKEALGRAANIRNLHEEGLKREAEREAQRKLGLQLIDIGFKALASQLHPDKRGGSKEAMARLNAVRDRLKMHA